MTPVHVSAVGFACAAALRVVGAPALRVVGATDRVGAGLLATLGCVAGAVCLGLGRGIGLAEPFSVLAAADSASPSSGGENLTGSFRCPALKPPRSTDGEGCACAAITPNTAAAGSASAGTAIPSLLAAFCAVSGAQWRPVLLIFLGLRCPDADLTTCLLPFLAQLLGRRWLSRRA